MTPTEGLLVFSTSVLLFSLRPFVAVTPPSDQVYMQAAAIFRQLRPEKPARQQHLRSAKTTDEPDSKDESVARRAYQLAFNTLKCRRLGWLKGELIWSSLLQVV